MSDSSAGVYKSKLFNFINRRSHQLMDQSKTVVRHLQVATIWGIQIALYPVYLLIQTSRVFIQQLQESVDKNSSRYLGEEEATSPSLPPIVDRPITQVLQLVEDFLNPEQVSNLLTFLPSQGTATLPRVESKKQDLLLASPSSSGSSILPPISIKLAREHRELHLNDQALGMERLGGADTLALRQELHFVVQGVASLIVSKSLVLIGTNNQILDILTLEQQQQLAKKITWEVASYGYDRRRFLESQRLVQCPANYQLPTPTNSRVLLPAKWFWRLMAWVQRGEVAIAANLFQESSLPRIAPVRTFLQLPSFSLPPLPIVPETIQRFDRQIYQIELNQIVPASQWLNQVGEELLPIIISPNQLMAQGKPAEINTQGSVHQGNLWELIQGAIAYFFGKNSSRLSKGETNENNYQLGSEKSNYLLDDLGQANYQRYQDLLSGASKPMPYAPYSISHGLISPDQQYQEVPFSEDDWLTSEDLFQSPLHQLNDGYEDEEMIDLPSITETKLLGQSSYPPLAQVMAAQGQRPEKSPKFPAPKSPSSSKLSPTAKTRRSSPNPSNSNSSKLTSAASTSISNHGGNKQGKLTNSRKSSSSLGNNSPDWIETEVTSKGYVKHPLQKSLEFLDEVVLGIEKILGQLWQLIKRIIKF